MLNQFPELYAGLHRDASSFPVQYLGANVPQAWAAGSVFSLLYAILGLQPDAPNATLYVDPVLPDWLADVTLRDLHLGEQTFDIRFWRKNQQSHFTVLKGEPSAVVRRAVPVQTEGA
jgi:glycogen debranching enzyme